MEKGPIPKDKAIHKVCDHCGESFWARRKDKKYHSRRCKDLARRLRIREREIEALGGKCADCGVAYSADKSSTFFLLRDGTMLCAKDNSRRGNKSFWKTWPKGHTMYDKSLRKTSKGPRQG